MQNIIKWKTQRNLIHGSCDPLGKTTIYGRPTIYPTYFEQNSGIVDWGAGRMGFFMNWGTCSSSNQAIWQSKLYDSSGNLQTQITYDVVNDKYDTIQISNIVDSTETCTINVDTSRVTTLTFTSYILTCWSKVYGYTGCTGPTPLCISEGSVSITVQLATSSFGCSLGSNIQQIPLQVSYPTGGITLYQHWGQTGPNLNQYYFDIDLTTLFTFSDSNCMKSKITSCFLQSKQGTGPNGWVSQATSNDYRIYLDTSNPITAQSIRIQCNSATGAIESYAQLWTVVAFTCSNVFTFTYKNYVFIIDDTNYQVLFNAYSVYVSSSDPTKCPVSSLTIVTGTRTTQISSQTSGQLIFFIPSTVGTYTYTIKACDYRNEACQTSNNYSVTILCGSPTASSIPTQNFQLGSMTIGVLATVGTSYMTIKDPTNCLLTYTITTQEYSTDNTIWKTSTDISIEDQTTGGRVLLTLPSQIYYYRYKIKAKRQTDSTKYAETTYNYVQMTCGPLSSVLQDQEKVYEYSLVQKVTQKNTLNFDTFLCNPNVCCDQPIIYQFYQYPWQASSTISTKLLTDPVETASGSKKYKYVVDVSLPRVIEFYIYGINSYGIKGFSTKIKITIVGECVSNKVSYNTLQPTSISDHQNYLNFSYSNPDNVPYLWLQYEQAQQKNQDSYDMSSRFFSSMKGCSLYYSIIKIVDYSKANAPISITDYLNNIFLDQDKGILTFQYFQRPVSYLIYMKAVDLSNNQSSPTTDYHVNLTVYPKNAKIPNNPPIFQYQAPDITKDIGTYDDEGNQIEPGADKLIVYKLPPVYDRELKPVNLTIGGLTPWMKYYPVNNSIVVDLDSANLTYVANFRILYKLTDPEGQFTQGSFNINLIPKAIRNRTSYQIIKDSKNWICSVSPKIQQVTEDGLLIVKFNMTMMTDFNHELINSKSTKIYIIPAMNRDQEEFFDKTQLLFNWTLLKFEKDIMFIQLYFEQSCEISPLETYDKIAIDFSNVQQFLYSGKGLSGLYDIFNFSGLQRRLQNKEFKQKILNGDICPLTVLETDSIIPRQIDIDSRYSSDSFSDFFAIVFIFCFIIGIIIGIFISDTIWALLASVRYLQICLHLPMLKTIFPSNVLRFMRKTLPLAHFDLANLIWLNYEQKFFSDQYEIFESDQSRYLGLFGFMEYLVQLVYIFNPYYTRYNPSGGHRFLAVLGLILIFILMPIVFLLGYRIHYKIKNENKIEQAEIHPINDQAFEEEELVKQKNQSLVQVQFPNSLNQTFEKQFPYQISSERPLSDKEDVFEGGGEDFYQNLWQRQKKIKQDYLNKVGIAYYQIKEPQLNQFFYPFCLLRRTIYIMIVFCAKNSSIQLWWMISLNFLSVCYVGYFKPMKTDIQNRIEYYNQLSAVLVTLHLLYFSGLGALSCSQKSGFGWSLIVIVSFNCIMCLLSIILRLMEILKLFLTKCWTKNKIKKLQELLEQLKRIKEEQEKQAEIDKNDPQAEEKKLENMKSEGYSAAYILMQTVNKNKEKKRKIRQLVTIDMDKVKGDNGLKEIVEQADEENSNVSQEQFIQKDVHNQQKKIKQDEMNIQDDGKQLIDDKSSQSKENQINKGQLDNKLFPDLIKKSENPHKHTCPPYCKKDDENHNCDNHHNCLPGKCFCFDRVNFNGYQPKNNQKQKKTHTCPPTCDRDESNHNCDSHHSCQPPKCKSHGDDQQQIDQINSGKKDQHSNENQKMIEDEKTQKNQNNDEDDFADNGPLYYDFSQEEIPAIKEAPKIKLSPRASQMVTENVSRILIEENSSRLINQNDSTFSFIEKQKADLSESADSDIFEKVNPPLDDKKIQKKQNQKVNSANQQSSERQANQPDSNLSTFRQVQQEDLQINPSPQISNPKNSIQIEEKKKNKSEKSSPNSSFEDNGPIYYDFDN